MRVLAVVAAILLIAGITLWVGKCGVPSQRELFDAIRSGDAQKVKSILAARPQILKEKEPPVRLPTAKECVKLLLQRGADPIISHRFGYTVLHHLAAFPRRYLKQEGGEAHINFQQQERWRVEVARVLIRAGADPAQTNVEGKTAADFARAKGSLELARFLQQASTRREQLPAATNANGASMLPQKGVYY